MSIPIVVVGKALNKFGEHHKFPMNTAEKQTLISRIVDDKAEAVYFNLDYTVNNVLTLADELCASLRYGKSVMCYVYVDDNVNITKLKQSLTAPLWRCLYTGRDALVIKRLVGAGYVVNHHTTHDQTFYEPQHVFEVARPRKIWY